MSEILSVTDEHELRRRFLFRPCESKEELHDWVLTFLGLDFPDCTVDEDSNSNPMEMIWEIYSKARVGTDEDFMRVLYFASRDSFKTLGVAAVETLAVLHLNINVAHMAAISDQSAKAQEYVKRSFRRPYIRDFVIGDNERQTKIIRYYNRATGHSLTRDEYEKLSTSDQVKHEEIGRALAAYVEKEQYIKIVICTLSGANSEHVPLFVVDELDVVANPNAYYEAQNIPAGRGDKLPLTVLTSTRKYAYGLVQKEIDNAKKSGLQIRHWNVLDITRACPPTRHRPDLPHLKLYTSSEQLRHVDEQTYEGMTVKEKETFAPLDAFQGCGRCKLFSVCKTRLATHQTSKSLMLKSIPEVIGKFDTNSIEMAKAQLLCLKPSSVGLIYSRFDKTRHILSPAQAYAKIFGEVHPDPRNFTKAMLLEIMSHREVEWIGGMDWGHTHNFAYVQGFVEGARCFVMNAMQVPELDPEQMLDICSPFKRFEPKIYADTADPKMTAIFRKYGYRMQKWDKGKGTVVGGINILRMKLNPPLGGEPELFLVHDLDEDPGMDLLITHLAEYHWKLDAAKQPTDVPSETDDDGCDALRYMVMNRFNPKGKLITGGSTVEEILPPRGQVYDQKNWMHQVIAEHTGVPRPIQPSRPTMQIEAPANSGFSSYYGDESDDSPGPSGGPGQRRRKSSSEDGPKGKRGKLIWDLT